MIFMCIYFFNQQVLSVNSQGQSQIVSLEEDDVEEEEEEVNEDHINPKVENEADEEEEEQMNDNSKGLTSDVPDVMQLPGFDHEDQTLKDNIDLDEEDVDDALKTKGKRPNRSPEKLAALRKDAEMSFGFDDEGEGPKKGSKSPRGGDAPDNRKVKKSREENNIEQAPMSPRGRGVKRTLENEGEEAEAEQEEKTTSSRRRGRPPKRYADDFEIEKPKTPAREKKEELPASSAKRRGRPPKKDLVEVEQEETFEAASPTERLQSELAQEQQKAETLSEVTPKPRRGRPPKYLTATPDTPTETPVQLKGKFSRKNVQEDEEDDVIDQGSEVEEYSEEEEEEDPEEFSPTKRRRQSSGDSGTVRPRSQSDVSWNVLCALLTF